MERRSRNMLIIIAIIVINVGTMDRVIVVLL